MGSRTVLEVWRLASLYLMWCIWIFTSLFIQIMKFLLYTSCVLRLRSSMLLMRLNYLYVYIKKKQTNKH
jgi:hypothetical protein